ncbi:MAG: hypothetical protein ACEPOZ_17845 [Marinifilaceae bacterium]
MNNGIMVFENGFRGTDFFNQIELGFHGSVYFEINLLVFHYCESKCFSSRKVSGDSRTIA